MTLAVRLTRRFWALACICMALCLSSLAHGQAANAATQQEQDDQPEAKVPIIGDSTDLWLGGWQQRDAFSGFLIEMAGEERQIQAELERGETVPRSRVNWAKILNIHEDQEHAMRNIVADSNLRIKILHDQDSAESLELREHRDEERLRSLHTRGIEHARQMRDIEDTMIGDLRQALGEEGFRNLELYLYRTRGWDKINAPKTRSNNSPVPAQKGNSPSSAPSAAEKPR